jgi:hypothetical protein
MAKEWTASDMGHKGGKTADCRVGQAGGPPNQDGRGCARKVAGTSGEGQESR